jgi:hypothetical protein
MEKQITHSQPTGVCTNCLRLAGDPGINCLVAQTLRESGVLAQITFCPKSIPMVSSNGQ